MEYTIAKLAQISGVTTRTLRYYDQIGLLCPLRVSNGYRIYGQKEAHKGLADMYVADDRFRANYDKIAPGCTEFLRDAIYIYCER